jgi:hypothetical protein
MLFLPEKYPEYEKILQISKKIETLGSFIHFKVRLTNTTRHFLQNLTLLFSWPEFMELQEERSKPNWIEIKEFQAEESQIFEWVLKQRHENIIMPSERLGVSSKIGELKIIIRYTNFFGVQQEIRKELEVFIP